MADVAVIDQSIAAAVDAAGPLRKIAPYERQAVLNHCVRRFEERAEELAMSLCIEADKPIKDSRGEANRLIDTLRIASEESVRSIRIVLPRSTATPGRVERVPCSTRDYVPTIRDVLENY